MAQAAPPPGNEQPKPVKPVKLKNPAGTAKAASALARFANGQLGTSGYDKRVQAALGKLPGAKDTAKRLITAIEAMPASERGKAFPGLKSPETLTTKPYDPPSQQASTGEQGTKAAAGVAVGVTTLAPDPANPNNKAQYELVYRGAKCDKTADPDGTDEPVVYVNMIGRKYEGNGWTYGPTPKYLPDSGTLTAGAGALTTVGAGPVWTSPTWPGAYGDGIVIVTGVLEDNGDLAQRKQELELLVQFGLSETDEDTVTQDRMEVLRRELEDALALLHLANPDRWSAKAIQVKKLTSSEYDQLYLKPSTAAPVPHKLSFQHDPRGSAYTLYFDIPPPVVSFKKVFLKIKEIEALGADRDEFENNIPDFGASVTIRGGTEASTTRLFPADKNPIRPGWTVERQIEAGRALAFEVAVFDDDPPPDCTCTERKSTSKCLSYCATPEKIVSCKEKYSSGGWNSVHYVGVCPRDLFAYDLNPAPPGEHVYINDARTALRFVYDTAHNKLSGDVNGAAGTYTMTGTEGMGNRARIVFEVGVK